MRLTRTTWILLAANAVCAALLWRSLPSGEAATSQTLAFPVAPAWIEVEGAAGKIRLERAEGGWRVSAPYRWTANRWEVARLLGELALVREAPPRIARPEAGERWKLRAGTEGGPAIEAEVIAENLPSGGRALFLDGGAQGKAVAGEALAKALALPAEAYRVDAVFSLAAFELRSVGVRLSRPPTEDRRWGLVLETRETVGRAEPEPAWRFEVPDNFIADAERAPRAIAALADLRVARFLVNRTQAEAKPWLRLSLEGASRREVLLLWPAKDGLCEAALEDNPEQGFLVELKAVQEWADPATALRSRMPFDFDAAGARGLALTELASGRTLVIHRVEGATGRWEMPVVPGSTATRRLEVSVGRAQQLLRLLTELRADGSDSGDTSNAAWHRLEVDFPGGKLGFEVAADPKGGRLLVRTGAGPALACPTDLPISRWLSVEPSDWRSEVLTRLPAGAAVVGIEITDKDGRKMAQARMGEDGRWVADGTINAAGAAALANQLALVQAASFQPESQTVARPETGWETVLRVTDRAAAGAAGASETTRTYRVTRSRGPGTLRLRDEADGTVFAPEPALAEALAAWTSP